MSLDTSRNYYQAVTKQQQKQQISNRIKTKYTQNVLQTQTTNKPQKETKQAIYSMKNEQTDEETCLRNGIRLEEIYREHKCTFAVCVCPK